MKRTVSTLIILAFALGAFAHIQVQSTIGNQINIAFQLNDYNIATENGFATIKIDGMEHPMQSGAALLPFMELKVGLPLSGNISWNIQNKSEEQITLPQRLLPVPTMWEEEGMSRMSYIIDDELYSQMPSDYATVMEPDAFRGLRYVSLRIHPFIYDGQNGLTILRNATFNIQIEGDIHYRGQPEPDELSELMLSQFINPQQARSWQSHSRQTINHAPFAAADYWLRIETDKKGLHKLSHQQLNALPLADIDPRTFRLFGTGGDLLSYTVQNPGPVFQEIDIWVQGEEDGHFDSGDAIIFYAETRDEVNKNRELIGPATALNPYSKNNVYWLTFGGDFSSPPGRIQDLTTPATWQNTITSQSLNVRIEEENHRREQWGSEWYMSKLFGNTTADYQYPIRLDNPDNTKDITLTIRLRQEIGRSDLWHSIHVFVNDVEIAPPSGSTSFRWLGSDTYIFQRKSDSFVHGDNTIRIRVNRTGPDNLLLDYISVDYTQTLRLPDEQYLIQPPYIAGSQDLRINIDGSLGNKEIYRLDGFTGLNRVQPQTEAQSFWFAASTRSNSRYIIAESRHLHSPASVSLANPTDLTLDNRQLDHIIIAPQEYITQAQSLASMYEDFYSLSVKVVDQAVIINQFNGGHPDPVALRQYLRHVYYHHQAPRLKGVTLIGLGTFDWRNHSRQSTPKNKLMAFQIGETTSDDFFAMMSSSSYPELVIGRYPVRTASELDNMLSNYRNYVQNPQGGWWRNSMVFLGDDLYNGSQTDYETIHTQQAESAANSVNPSIHTDRIFAWEYEYDEYQNKPGARDDMVAAINDGRLVWYYVGHGNADSIGSEDYFNGATDMGRFNNPDRLPFFMVPSCKVSQFDHWGFDSLGQKVVMLNNLGAIASLGATRMSNAYSNHDLMLKVLDNLANKRNYLGYSIMAGKLGTTALSNNSYYVLLGDPTLRVIPPERDSLLHITSPEGNPTLQSRQLVNYQGSLASYTGSATAETRVLDSRTFYNLDMTTRVSQPGKTIFRGDVSTLGGDYEAAFIVPDDITNGETGTIVTYIWDEQAKRDYINYLYPVATSDQAVAAENLAPPEIELFLGSFDYREGDTVPTKTTLLARISDDNGINITGSPGHNILLVLDNSIQPISVTQYFSYQQDSHTTGILRYPLNNLSEGPHSVQLIAFDNFNLPAVASTSFMAKKSSGLSIDRLLIYPNPMQDEAHFTFILSRDSQLDIGIYTVSGKRIRHIKTNGRQGFNQIPWDGKDHNGHRLANNTYFLKIKATSGSQSVEARERIVIYK
ncbi:MAG: type IX secretion system sortase PorU [Candidatus Cloacimonetes bacterium]|nr:type IX secretion system sortase PorU [Candidatus Cloacimonadota bacterium]